MSDALHLPVLYRPEGESRHSLPAEVCSQCSDFETGKLVPASFCEEAKARMGRAPWEPQPRGGVKKPEHAADRCYRIYDGESYWSQHCSEREGHDGLCGTNWEWCDRHNEGSCLL